MTHSGHCLSRSTWTPLRFLGSVAVLPPIVAVHVLASHSDALPGLQVRLSGWLVTAHSRRSLIQCVRSMDNGTTGRFSRGPRSISDLGHVVGCLAAKLRDYCRAAFLGTQFLPVISVTDTRRQAMRIAEHSVPCSAFGAHLAHKITTPSGAIDRKVSTAIRIDRLRGTR